MRATPHLSTARWRKSSYSDGQEGGECVEVADNFPGTIPIRDSKNPTGPALLLPTTSWEPFVNGVKHGAL